MTGSYEDTVDGEAQCIHQEWALVSNKYWKYRANDTNPQARQTGRTTSTLYSF